ncbi:MAG: formylglycine-generating enzyme family protein [Nitrospira sp.]|nr:formylglycine-generating enzyme family protein [Nitrospira sp.]
MRRQRRWNPLLLVTAAWLALACPQAMAQSLPTDPRDPVRMITIPAGPFLMGSRDGTGQEDERPMRSVFVDAFSLDEVEVTNDRYLRFVQATGHKLPPNPYGEGPLSALRGIGNLPVVQVTWHDAQDYCEWAGKRLPTEAEWEKAARGTDGRIYPWGNESPTPQRANFDREWDGVKTLLPVGSLPEGPSPYGVADLAGNAREWVADWYDPAYYRTGRSRNPAGPDEGILKGIRGGSWRHNANDIRAAMRGKGGFALRTDGTGFRCARGADGN